MQAALLSAGGHLALSNAPFPRAPLWTPGPEGSYWYADSDRYHILRLGTAEADTLAEISVAFEGAPVTDEDWENFVRGREDDPSSPRARERRELPRPDRKPVLADLLSASTGDLWVRLCETRTDSTEWHVYTADGTPRFRLHLAPNMEIRSVSGDTILAVVRDSLDIQRIHVLEIVG